MDLEDVDNAIQLLSDGVPIGKEEMQALRWIRARVAELEGELETSRMKVINLRLERDEEKRARENVDRCLRETQKLRLEDAARVAALDKVHAAAGRHMAANGPCDLRDESDEADDYEGGNCSESDCTYCALDRIASAVDEAPDQRGEDADG